MNKFISYFILFLYSISQIYAAPVLYNDPQELEPNEQFQLYQAVKPFLQDDTAALLNFRATSKTILEASKKDIWVLNYEEAENFKDYDFTLGMINGCLDDIPVLREDQTLTGNIYIAKRSGSLYKEETKVFNSPVHTSSFLEKNPRLKVIFALNRDEVHIGYLSENRINYIEYMASIYDNCEVIYCNTIYQTPTLIFNQKIRSRLKAKIFLECLALNSFEELRGFIQKEIKYTYKLVKPASELFELSNRINGHINNFIDMSYIAAFWIAFKEPATERSSLILSVPLFASTINYGRSSLTAPIIKGYKKAKNREKEIKTTLRFIIDEYEQKHGQLDEDDKQSLLRRIEE